VFSEKSIEVIRLPLIAVVLRHSFDLSAFSCTTFEIPLSVLPFSRVQCLNQVNIMLVPMLSLATGYKVAATYSFSS